MVSKIKRKTIVYVWCCSVCRAFVGWVGFTKPEKMERKGFCKYCDMHTIQKVQEDGKEQK